MNLASTLCWSRAFSPAEDASMSTSSCSFWSAFFLLPSLSRPLSPFPDSLPGRPPPPGFMPSLLLLLGPLCASRRFLFPLALFLSLSPAHQSFLTVSSWLTVWEHGTRRLPHYTAISGFHVTSIPSLSYWGRTDPPPLPAAEAQLLSESCFLPTAGRGRGSSRRWRPQKSPPVPGQVIKAHLPWFHRVGKLHSLWTSAGVEPDYRTLDTKASAAATHCLELARPETHELRHSIRYQVPSLVFCDSSLRKQRHLTRVSPPMTLERAATNQEAAGLPISCSCPGPGAEKDS